MTHHFFAVVHLNKRKMLFLGLVGLLIIAFTIFIIGSLISIGTSTNNTGYITLDFETIIQKEGYSEELHTMYPRYFIAGGTSYDNSILEQHGIKASTDNNINHFEQVGVYALKSEVIEMVYYPDTNKVQIFVDSQEQGYTLVSFSKNMLNEGPITYEFVDTQGQRILIEEDYVYSVPIEYVVLEESEEYVSTSTLDRFVIVDNEVKPVLASYGYDIEILEETSDNNLSIYVFGGKVETVQKQGDNLRVYFNDSEGYQVISLNADGLKDGQNLVKFIRESDLREIETISFWKNN